MPMHVYSYICSYSWLYTTKLYIGTMLLYTYLYTQRSEETKRKQSEQRRLATEEEKLDENAAYSPPDKGHYFDNEITPS